MKQITLPILLFLFLYGTRLFSQTMLISGTVLDTAANTPLPNAVVVATRLSDSMLVRFTRSDLQGKFKMDSLLLDTLRLLISHPRFGERDFILLGSSENHVFDLGSIKLPPKSQQLAEVTVYANKDPIYYKGDTLVYTVDSFKVKSNAVVEDLLKKLPGIQVDEQGKIRSQGKEIKQVLVDGDEFFGSDPTVATRNLAANGVESVQLYDKKSEDGAEGSDATVKVMNLKMKEEAKKGYFGKAAVASDFRKFYEGELLANRFRNAQKISVFALGSNTPRSSFDWGDVHKYGLNNEMTYVSDDGGNDYYLMKNNNASNGIPKIFKTGFYYSDTWAKNTKINVDYNFNQGMLSSTSITRSQFLLSDTSYSTQDSTKDVQKTATHTMNMKWKQNLDSLTNLVLEPSLKLNKVDQFNHQVVNFVSKENILTRQTQVQNNNESANLIFSNRLLFDRKFKKKDRLFKLSYKFSQTATTSDGFLFSSDLSDTSTTQIDQRKTMDVKQTLHNVLTVFTEPITRKVRLEIEYLLNRQRGKQDRLSQTKFNESYSLLDTALSNNFDNTRTTHRFGTKIIFEDSKARFSLGSRLQNIQMLSKNYMLQTRISQHVNALLPYATYSYRFSQSKRVGLEYYTYSTLPTISQLQPVKDNTNPNQLKLGNPHLQPSFTHSLSMYFNNYKAVSGKYIWFSSSYSTTYHGFATATIYDDEGRVLSQTVNANGNQTTSANAGFVLPFAGGKMQWGLDADMSYSQYTNFVNSQSNRTNALASKNEINWSIRLDTVEFQCSYQYQFDAVASSLNVTSQKPYDQHIIRAGCNLDLPFEGLLGTDLVYTANTNRAPGYNIHYLIWNASIKKSFLKNENLILSLVCNDMLNKNVSTNRTVQGNVITDFRTTIVGRYFLVKLVFKFNNSHTKETDGF